MRKTLTILNKSPGIGFNYIYILMVLNLLIMVGCAVQKKEKPQLDLLPYQKYYMNEMHAGKSTATFKIPTRCLAYSILTIDYTLSGSDISAAVEANAFENSELALSRGASNSALPYHLGLEFRYLGSLPSKGLGEKTLESVVRRRRNFSTTKYYHHIFQIINSDNCILKCQGFGMVTYRIRILDKSGKIIDRGDNYVQALDHDLYPGDTTTLSWLINPLPTGTYTLQLIANLHNDTVLDSEDAGPIIAKMTLPVQILDEENPNPGFLIPQQEEVVSPTIFPNNLFHWEEFLQAFQVHSLGKEKNYGQLYLEMPMESQYINLKLVTPYGVANASWNIKIDLNPELQSLTQKASRKTIFKNSQGRPSLFMFYDPKQTARFSLDANSTIHSDLTEIKDLGIDAVYVQMFPNNLSDDTTPIQLLLNNCKKLGMKVIPSIYSDSYVKSNHTSQLGMWISDLFDQRNPDFPKSLSQWFEKLEKTWKNVFYHTSNGNVLVTIRDDKDSELWNSPSHGGTRDEINEFMNWLAVHYSDISSVNSKWNSHYHQFSEINPMTENIFYEWSTALQDWDEYRSYSRTRQWGLVAQEMHKQNSNVMTGIMPYAVYGIESVQGQQYYSLYNFNWVGAREEVLAEHLFNKQLSGLDFITYVINQPDMDITKISSYAKSNEIEPVLMLEYCGTKFIQGLENHPEWESSGGWKGLPGIHARDYRMRMSLYPRLKAVIESGAAPGIASWNNQILSGRLSEVQKHEIRLYQKLLLGK